MKNALLSPLISFFLFKLFYICRHLLHLFPWAGWAVPLYRWVNRDEVTWSGSPFRSLPVTLPSLANCLPLPEWIPLTPQELACPWHLYRQSLDISDWCLFLSPALCGSNEWGSTCPLKAKGSHTPLSQKSTHKGVFCDFLVTSSSFRCKTRI